MVGPRCHLLPASIYNGESVRHKGQEQRRAESLTRRQIREFKVVGKSKDESGGKNAGTIMKTERGQTEKRMTTGNKT